VPLAIFPVLLAAATSATLAPTPSLTFPAALSGVKGDEVCGSFAGTFRNVTGGPACSFAYVTGTAAYASTGASALRGWGWADEGA
jgi:hypothetical protein